ncbi:Speckle-type POZ protein [Fasciola gigantica]|uniref:Speckle-type POZ protein n=1 Tax=Fasciola gigantica TaxID=46835 RepID=A0A504YDF7_FASGI|nr:Speckle-type POZ protein [Fasciola gigantica]
MDALRATLDSTDGQVTTVSRTSSPPPLDILTPPVVAEYWCHTQVRVTKMKYIWTISNFSFCREEMGEVVKSSFFSCGPNDKLKWCLRINPKGLDEESREYLSLYLLLVNCGTKSEARAKFKFSLLNAKREETKAMESQRAYRFVQGKDWGFKKFIRRDVLMDEANGLLPNDRLTILCEVSVVGETLSECGQVNIQPITVPECNLHEDIGSLLFKQILTDVTLVVVSNANQSSDCKCQTPFSLTHGSSAGNNDVCGNSNSNNNNNNTTSSASSVATNTTTHVLSRADANKKYSRFDRSGTDDDADDGEDGDLDEEEQEEVEETEDFDEDDEADEEDPDQEQESEEREDDSQGVYRSARVSCATTDEAIHIGLHHHSHHAHHQQVQHHQQSQQQQQQQIASDQGESEATPRCNEAPNVVGTGTNEHVPPNAYMTNNSGLHLAPTSTTIPIMTKGVSVPTGTAVTGRYTCANVSAVEANMPKPLIDTSNPPASVSGTAVGINSNSGNADWRFAPSSSNFTQSVQPGLPPTEDHEAARAGGDVSCDMCGSNSLTPLKLDGHRCRNCGRTSNAIPSTSSVLPTTSTPSCSSASRLHVTPSTATGDMVGSSSGNSGIATSGSNSMGSAFQSCTHSSHSASTSTKVKNESVEGMVEAETSGSATRVRRSTRRRTTNNNNNNGSSTTTTNSSSNVNGNTTSTTTINGTNNAPTRSSRSRASRDTAPCSTVTKAASTTTSVASTTTSSTHASPTQSGQTASLLNGGSSERQNKSIKLTPSASPGAGDASQTAVTTASNGGFILRQFEAHKAILAARSPVFAAMFEHGMEESRANRVEITDMEPDTLAEVLRYIYTGQVIGLDKLAHDLLAAADKYQLERLKTMCEEALVESLTVENACDILGLADTHNAEQLKAHTLEFIMLHAHDVCETEGYEQLVRHRPRLLNECFRSLASQQLPLRCWARKRPRQS